MEDRQTEEDRLRAVIRTDHPNHLLEFEIVLATGMRRSEMYAATWSDFDFERDPLVVPRTKHGETRQVTLNSAAKTRLEFLKARMAKLADARDLKSVHLIC